MKTCWKKNKDYPGGYEPVTIIGPGVAPCAYSNSTWNASLKKYATTVTCTYDGKSVYQDTFYTTKPYEGEPDKVT